MKVYPQTTKLLPVVLLGIQMGAIDICSGFTTFPSPTTRLATQLHHNIGSDDQHYATNTNHHEIDRRLAMVKAAAAAASMAAATTSATIFPVEPAVASSAIFSLEAKVTGIENQNLTTKNSSGDPTKHTPVVEFIDNPTIANSKLVQFTVPHVMDPEKPHYIQYMWIEDVSGKKRKPPGNIVAVKSFKPTDPSPPTLTENIASGKLATLKAPITKGMILKPCLYCNLHGLWQGEPVPV